MDNYNLKTVFIAIAILLISGCQGGGESSIANGQTSSSIANPVTLSTDEDTAVTGILSSTDNQASGITYEITKNPANGTATITNAGSGIFVYEPNPNFFGLDDFTFQVTDSTGESNTAVVQITVNPVQDPPQAFDANITTNEDSAISSSLNASDMDGDTLLYTISDNGNKGNAIITNSSSGAFTYIPNPNKNGTDSFTFLVNDGNANSAPATVTVTINSIEDVPKASNDNLETDEDTPFNGSLNGFDGDGDSLIYSIASNGNKGTAVITDPVHGIFTYTPNPDANGSDSFTYMVNDGKADSNIATVQVSINAVNDQPSAIDDAVIGSEDTTLTFNVLQNDLDPDVGDILSVIDTTQGPDVSVIINSDDSLTFIPDSNFSGSNLITYTVSDTSGLTDTAVIAVTYTPQPDAPTITTDPVTAVNVNETYQYDVDATDPDTTALVYSLDTKPSGMTIDPASGVITWPTSNSNVGYHDLTVRVTDPGDPAGTYDTQNFTLMVGVSDDFTDDIADGWTVVDDAGNTSNWLVIGNEYVQTNYVESLSPGNPFIFSYHLGTYSYLQSGFALSDYRVSADITPLPNNGVGIDGNDVGLMFRYQNNNNYYRLSFNSRYGFTRLEKRISGTFTPLATDARGYIDGQLYHVDVDIQGARILVYINGDPVFSVIDTSLVSGSVALYAQDRAKFDNVVIEQNSTDPAVVLSTPLAYSVEPGGTLAASAIAANVPAGGYVDFILDSGTIITDSTPPYTANFTGVATGDHQIEAVLYDALDTPLASDLNTTIGAQGEYDVTIGDSITNGEVDNYAADNISQDGRLIASQGYQANLEDSLPAPAIVFNEGIGGDESQDTANNRIDSILDRHPNATRLLVLLGTNDALGSLPVDSGLGCSGAACNGTFKGNMQTIIDKTVWADYPANTVPSGKTIYIAPVTPIWGSSKTSIYSNPLAASKNQLLQDYNTVITTELTNRVVGPDLFDFFLTPTVNRFSLFFDYLHPNALGHVVMARLWHNALTGDTGIPFILEDLGRSTVSPYLKQNLLEVGDRYYVDETYTLSSIPGQLDGGRWIMMANADRTNTSSNYLSFTVDRSVTVYVAYDAGATALPDWLRPAAGFSDAGLQLTTTDPGTPALHLYQQVFGSGTITLGGNQASGASGAGSHYVVIVVEN